MRDKSVLRAIGIVFLGLYLLLDLHVAQGAGAFRPKPAPHPPPAETRIGQWQQDIDYLASELPRLHYDLYHTISAADFATAISELRADIPELSDDAIRVRIARIVALIGDGHTSLSGWTAGNSRIPLRLQWFSDGLYVVQVESGREALLTGEVVRIDTSDMETAMRSVSQVISADNEAHLRARSAQFLRNVTVLHQLGLSTRPDSVTFAIRKIEGDTVEVTFPSAEDQIEWVEASSSAIPLYRQRQNESYWYELLPGTGILYFKYNQCVLWNQFRKFAKELKKVIAKEEIDCLMVDFRGNGGGNSLLFQLHLLGFIRRNDDLNQEGHLYSAIDGGTFSSAVLNAVALERKTRAITIGEPTGGKPNHFGEVRTFSLPNSGLVIQYSTKYFKPYPELGDAPSLEPEIAVPLSSSDYFSGQDPVLERILSERISQVP